jgi:hypothetical protein
MPGDRRLHRRFEARLALPKRCDVVGRRIGLGGADSVRSGSRPSGQRLLSRFAGEVEIGDGDRDAEGIAGSCRRGGIPRSRRQQRGRVSQGFGSSLFLSKCSCSKEPAGGSSPVHFPSATRRAIGGSDFDEVACVLCEQHTEAVADVHAPRAAAFLFASPARHPNLTSWTPPTPSKTRPPSGTRIG